MKIDKNTIQNLAKLVRIKIQPSEEEKLTSDLNDILEMMDQLNEIDTSQVQPFTHFSYTSDQLRKDKEIKQDIKKETLVRAPKSDQNYFIVPKVIKHDE